MTEAKNTNNNMEIESNVNLRVHSDAPKSGA